MVIDQLLFQNASFSFGRRSIDIGERADKILGTLLHTDEITAQRGGAVQYEENQCTVLFLSNSGGTCRVEFGLFVPSAYTRLFPQFDIIQIRL